MEKYTRKSLCVKRWSLRPESQDLQQIQVDQLWTRRKDADCSKKVWKKTGCDSQLNSEESVTT